MQNERFYKIYSYFDQRKGKNRGLKYIIFLLGDEYVSYSN